MKKGISKQQAFLAAYCQTASITRAARAAQIDRVLHYRWLRDDPDYAALFQGARIEAGDVLVDEAVRRAHRGVLKPVLYKGKLVYREIINRETGEVTLAEKPLAFREYSDENLRFLIKGFKPEFRERGVEASVTGPAGLTWEEFVVMYRRTVVQGGEQGGVKHP